MRKAKADKQKPVKEPVERTLYRMGCKSIGYTGTCFKHSGDFKMGDTVGHISMACDRNCRRMKLWDTKHGYKGVEFKLVEMY